MNEARPPADIFSLTDKTVLLTGASSGIGARFARVLHAAGANVAVVARRAEALAALAAELPGVVPIIGDLSITDDLDALYDRVIEAVGDVDVLINNAATIAGGVPAEDETPEEINRTLNVNLVAPIRLAQRAYPSMRDRGQGSIINITSMVASVGIGRFPQATYAASKGGLESISREWAAQWSRHGVRINCIAPGFIETEMAEGVIHRDNVQQWILRNTLLPRHGQPDDFDGALLYLASDASRYVTGQVLVVDGGWTAH